MESTGLNEEQPVDDPAARPPEEPAPRDLEDIQRRLREMQGELESRKPVDREHPPG